jgi:hypothetical protein
VLNKASRIKDAVDMLADDPDGAMDRFTDGLRRVLLAPKRKRGHHHQPHRLHVKRRQRT